MSGSRELGLYCVPTSLRSTVEGWVRTENMVAAGGFSGDEFPYKEPLWPVMDRRGRNRIGGLHCSCWRIQFGLPGEI